MAINFDHQRNKLSSSSDTITIDNTGSIKIPSGATLNRPATPASGEIRYNSDLQSFEGYINTNWTSLGGVKDVDGNTYIIAENGPGVNNNELDFYTDGTKRLQIGDTGNFLFGNALNKFTIDYSTGNTAIAGTLDVNGATGIDGNFDIATNKFTIDATTGNTSVAGTLGVTGASTLAGLSATTGSFSSTLDATGNFAINTNKFTVDATTGNTLVAGTLGVTGATTLAGLSATTGSFSSTLDVTGNLAVNTNKFTVDATSGNTIVAGTLDVTGATGIDGNFDIATNKFTVDATSGNTAIAGTLDVSSDTGIDGNFDIATNKFTVAAITGNTSVAGTLVVNSSITAESLTIPSGTIESVTGLLAWTYNNNSYDIASQETLPTGLYVRSNGVDAYLIGQQNAQVRQYYMSTPYNISTLTFVTSFNTSSNDATPTDITFKPDGTEMYITGASNSSVYRYTLSTPWDISTASLTSTEDISVYDTLPYGIEFKSDGSKMYITGYENNSVTEYDLSSSWDTTTATLNNTFSLTSTEVLKPNAIQFSSSGSEMYILGGRYDVIAKYNLSTAWDVSTATITDSVAIQSANLYNISDPTALSIIFSSDRLYISGKDTARLYEFKLDGYASFISGDRLIIEQDLHVKDTLIVYTQAQVNGTFRATNASVFEDDLSVWGNLDSQSGVLFSTTTGNIDIGTQITTGIITVGGTNQTSDIIIGQSSETSTIDIASGGTSNGNTKTVNLGVYGVSGSTTSITLGSDTEGALSYVSLNGKTDIFAHDNLYNSVATPLEIFHNVYNASTPAVGVGTGISFRAETSTVASIEDQTQLGKIEFIATDVTSTSESAKVEISVINSGSVDVGLTVAAGGNTTVAGDLTVNGGAAINGGDITTTQTSFNLLNTTATTITAFNAGTSIIIGADNSGTLTIRNETTAIQHNATVGGTLDVTGNLAINTNKFTVDATTGNTSVAGTLDVTSATGIDGNFDIATNKFTVDATTGNTSVAGTLDVTGATGIDGNFDIATNKFTVDATTGNTSVAGTLDATGDFAINTNKFNVTASSGDTAIAGTLDATGDFAINTNKFNVTASSGDTAIAGTLGVTGASILAELSATTGSFSSTLDVTGATGIDGNFDIATNKFTVDATTGNTSVAGTLSVGSDITVTGNLTVNGITTTVNSTTVTLDDPIITLGGDTAPTVDDNKDRGVEFRWHNGTSAKVGFFGFDDSSGKFTFIPDATNTGEVFSGTVGDAAFGNVTLGSSTINSIQLGISASNEIDTTAGNLVLDSFGGTVEITDNATISGTLDVTGAVGIDGNFDIATNKFTVASATGNTAIAGTLDVTGATSIDGNFDIATNKFTVNATTGNTSVTGTLGVTGASTLAGLSATTGAFSSTLSSTGNFTVNTNKFTVAAATGNTTVAGTLGVAGNTTVGGTLGVTGATTLSNTLGVAGNTTIDGNLYIRDSGLVNRFTVANSTGNTTVGGTLSVTSATTLSSTLAVASDTTLSGVLNVTGNVNVNTNKFNIVAASGNTTIAGTLGVNGATTLSSTLGVTGDFAINTNKFNVTAASGNTTIAGTLGVTGATTLGSTANVVGNFSVNTNKFAVNATTGAATFNNAFTLPTADGTANKSLTTNGSGVVSWVDTNTLINWNVANNYAFKSITDGTNTAVADSNTDTFKIRSGDQIEVTVTNDDATHGDSVLIGHADSGVAANTYGSTTAIPVITVDAQGHITSASTASISTYWTISDGVTSQQIDGGNTLTVSGTANEIEVAVSATDTLTIGLPDDVTIGNDLTVTTDASIGNDLNVTNNTLLGGTLQVTGATTLSNTLDVTGITNFNNATGSTSYTTGAVIIDGGVGVAENLYVNGTINGSEVNLSYTDFAGIANASAPAYQEGRMYYDTDAKTLVLYGNNSDFDMPVGEREWVRVRNSSGATIYKGQPVYATGVHIAGHAIHGHHPTVALADASDINKIQVLGLAAHDIADAAHGYVIVRGYIDNIDTSTLTSGSQVHLGFASPGTIVDSTPGYPNYPVDLGLALTSDASTGTIYVDIQTHTFERLRVTGTGRVDGDFTVGGNLTILGSSSSVSLNNLNVDSSFIYLNAGDTIGESSTNFTGSGLDDAYFVGHFNGTSSTTYYVRIDSVGGGTGGVDTFEWSLNNFSTTEATGIDLSTSPVSLQDNISIVWAETTGHTLNNVWDGTAAPVNVDNAIIGNRNTGTGGVGYTHIGLFFDVSDEKWKIFSEYDPEPTTNIDTGHASFNLGTLVANTFEGSFSGNATTATQLETSRTIWGQSFSGAGNVSGNLTSVGNITGSSAITLTAGGSNQNITITPSGTGYTLLNGNVGINTATPQEKLHVEGAVRIDSTYNLYSSTATLSSTSQTAIASFAASTFGGGKVVIQVYDTVTGARTITELLVVHNGSTASATQYAIINTGASDLADFDVNISGGNVRILATQVSTNSTQYKVVQTLILA